MRPSFSPALAAGASLIFLKPHEIALAAGFAREALPARVAASRRAGSIGGHLTGI